MPLVSLDQGTAFNHHWMANKVILSGENLSVQNSPVKSRSVFFYLKILPIDLCPEYELTHTSGSYQLICICVAKNVKMILIKKGNMLSS